MEEEPAQQQESGFPGGFPRGFPGGGFPGKGMKGKQGKQKGNLPEGDFPEQLPATTDEMLRAEQVLEESET